MPFDPDAYLAEMEGPAAAPKPSFDPDAYLAEMEQPAPKEERGVWDRLLAADERGRKRSKAEGLTGAEGAAKGIATGLLNPFAAISRGLRSAGNVADEVATEFLGPQDVGRTALDALRGSESGATLGLSDELTGAAGAGLRKLSGEQTKLSDLVTGQDKSLAGLYRTERDKERAGQFEARERSPWAYGGGEVVGGMSLPMPAAKGATLLAKLGKGALTGAGAGAAYGFGQSGADLTRGEVGQALLDTGTGAALGGVGGAVGTAVGEGLSKVAPVPKAVLKYAKDKLDDFAAKRALKAAGYIGKDIKPLARRNPAELVRRGKELLDSGVIGFGDDAAAIEAKLDPAVGEAGERIGQLLQSADDTGAKFKTGEWVERARRELLDPVQNDPAKAAKAKWLASKLDEYAQKGDVPFSEANRWKTNLQSEINYGNRMNDASPDPQEFWKGLAGTMTSEIDSQLGREGGEAFQQTFQKAKGKYGALVDALDKSRQGIGRDEGNQFLSGGDKLIGTGIGSSSLTASMMAGDPWLMAGSAVLGGASMLGSKVLRERGASSSAVVANKLAGGLDRMVKARPEIFGRFAPVLQQAAARGPQILAATNFVLAQKVPGYRELMQKMAEGKEPEQFEPQAAR